MKCVSSAEICRIDERAIREYGLPSCLLMENAGRSVSDVVSREYRPCSVLVVVGKGNNGGDGLVVARHLANRGYRVQIVLLEDPLRLKADPLLNFSIVQKMNIPWSFIPASGEKISEYCQAAELIVDAIFGVGIHGLVHGIFEIAIQTINDSKKPVLSIDIPSGLDADTGRIQGVAVRATKTVTFSLPKTGLFQGDGPQCAGEIEVVDIGIPRELLAAFSS